jgi:soluble lytic murein transglycosylase-like protein
LLLIERRERSRAGDDGSTATTLSTGGGMQTVQRFRARSMTAVLAILLVALPVARATAQGDPTRTVEGAPVPSALDSAFGEVARVVPAPVDSVGLIAQLLTTNGATRERALPAAAAIMKYARLHALDPLLVVGVIGAENASLKPRARSRVGARGVMQVMPSWRRDIRDCGDDLRLIHVNVCFGTRILRIALDETSTVREALLRYNGCVRTPGCHRYADAVFAWAGRALVLSRAAELSAAPTASAPRAVTRTAVAVGAEGQR